MDQANSPDECEKLYEESLWCLYALQDDLLQTDNPFVEEDRSTIQTCQSFVLSHPGSYLTVSTLQGLNEQSFGSFDVASVWV